MRQWLAMGVGIGLGVLGLQQQPVTAQAWNQEVPPGVLTIDSAQGVTLYHGVGNATKAPYRLPDGSRWRFNHTTFWHGNRWYNLGGDQWVIGTGDIALTDGRLQQVKQVVTTKAQTPVYRTYDGTVGPTTLSLPAGSHWRSTKQVWVPATKSTWVNLGHHQWVKQAALVQPKVAQINYVPGYGVALWQHPAQQVVPGRKLAHGSRWRVTSTRVVNGHLWLNLGGNQWLDAWYALVS